jgi:hypothetical protein
MPGLPVAQSLVEFADEVGRLFRDPADRGDPRLVEKSTLTEQKGPGQVVGEPDRLQVGRGEQPSGTKDIVRVRKRG